MEQEKLLADIAAILRCLRRRFIGYNIYLSSPEDLILIKLLWYKKTESTR